MKPLPAVIVEQVTGLKALSLDPLVGRGMSNEVVIVSTSDRRFVVRLNDAPHLRTFEKETWCLEHCHQRGILVPRVLATGIEGGRAYSLAHFIEGSCTIRAEIDRLRVWKTLGLYASKLNGIHIDLADNDSESTKWFNQSWEDVVAEEIELSFGDEYWELSGVLTNEQLLRLKIGLESLAGIKAPLGVCQIDMCCENALIRNSNYDEIYLLDLELTTAAPVPHYQLACVARTWGLTSDIMKAFRAGYGLSDSAFGEIMQDLQRLTVLRTMRQAGRARQKNSDSKAQDNENARRMIFELMGEELN